MIHGRQTKKIIFTWRELLVDDDGIIVARFPASCVVRNELNGKRSLSDPHDVVKTFPVKGPRRPYMPRQFPSGIYLITNIERTNDVEFAPYKIKTTATREVFTWTLNKNGAYSHAEENTQIDSQYHIHYTASRTTLGCIRVNKEEDVITLAELLIAYKEEGFGIFLEVL